jgi:hypothetical protein
VDELVEEPLLGEVDTFIEEPLDAKFLSLSREAAIVETLRPDPSALATWFSRFEWKIADDILNSAADASSLS